MIISRERWVIVRANGTEIFCGLARNYQFKPIYDIGDTAIKTYLSKKKALSGFESSWSRINFEYEAIPVIESIIAKEA